MTSIGVPHLRHPVTEPLSRDEVVRRVLLTCGIASSLLYVAMNVFFAMQWEGYSSASQTVSELSAVGAPTRTPWVLAGVVYALLVMAFGWGVWRSAPHSRPLRAVGALLVAYGAPGLLAWPLAPMHQRAVLAAGGGTMTDTMHIVLSFATVLMMLVAIGLGTSALGERFRDYSIATLLVLLTFGALTGMDAPRVSANLPTPWIGVWERIDIGVFLLWVVVLASALLRAPADRQAVAGGASRDSNAFDPTGRPVA